MADALITVGGGRRLVIASGTVLVENDEPVSIGADEITVVFRFDEDGGTASKIHPEKIDERTIEFTLTNCLSLGLDETYGRLNGKPLIIAFALQTLLATENNKKLRIIHYTFSTGDGWNA